MDYPIALVSVKIAVKSVIRDLLGFTHAAHYLGDAVLWTSGRFAVVTVAS